MTQRRFIQEITKNFTTMCVRFIISTLPPSFLVGGLEIRLSLSFSVELKKLSHIRSTLIGDV